MGSEDLAGTVESLRRELAACRLQLETDRKTAEEALRETKAAGEALRASEQVSRGQVDALKSTLDALASEPSHERLVGHILA